MLAPQERFSLACLSLLGLSIGDGLGKQLFLSPGMRGGRRLPQAPWMFTDDTRMASALVSNLQEHGSVDQDSLALRFASDFMADPDRGYGAVAHFILHRMATGLPWQEATRLVYSGEGSLGNGAAMRVAPLGAFFGDDASMASTQARLSAQPTHAHPEGQAGAIAVAVAATLCCQARASRRSIDAASAFDEIVAHVSHSAMTQALRMASSIPPSRGSEAVERLGTGEAVTAIDTVPFALWFALHERGGFVEAMWRLFEMLPGPDSDCDTIGAIVGGLLALVNPSGIPKAWIQSVEKTPHTMGQPPL